MNDQMQSPETQLPDEPTSSSPRYRMGWAFFNAGGLLDILGLASAIYARFAHDPLFWVRIFFILCALGGLAGGAGWFMLRLRLRQQPRIVRLAAWLPMLPLFLILFFFALELVWSLIHPMFL